MRELSAPDWLGNCLWYNIQLKGLIVMNVLNNVNSAVTSTSSSQSLVESKKNTDDFSKTVNEIKETPKKPVSIDELLRPKAITAAEFERLVEKRNTTDEERRSISGFASSPENQDYMRNRRLKAGDDKDIEKIITIGNDKITVNYNGSITSPNSYSRYISDSGSLQETLNNLYQAFGRGNVREETFAKGEGPTNKEYFEETTGKSFYRFVMSDGRLS